MPQGTPVVLTSGSPGGRDEIVTNGSTVRGYDAASGELLWWLSPNSEITVASPVTGDGMAFITGGYPPARPVYAVRAGSRGDLSLPEGETSSDAVAWSLDRGGAYMPTPLLYQGILYVFHGNGRLAAYDPATGGEIYKERVGAGSSFSGSPVAADGRLFFTSEQGETFVVRAVNAESGQGYTPFEGQELTGRVKYTFLRGRQSYANGNIVGPAQGQYLRRPTPLPEMGQQENS